MKSYRRKENIQPKHSYIVRYLTHDTIGHVNRFEIDDTDMSIDDIVKTSLIGSSKDDYPIEIVDIIIDGKKISKSELNAINDRFFNQAVYECDGGGAGGDAGGAASGGDAAGDVAADAGGISTEDVLGKMEPGKGYMGPGNFYIPSRVKVPFTRYQLANGGSKRKKTKSGKNKKYSYEKGMKVVVKMFEADGVQDKVDSNKIRKRLAKFASEIKNLDDVKKIDAKMKANGAEAADKFSRSKYSSMKQTFIDFGRFVNDVVRGKHKTSWFTLTMIATALIYVLTPVDLIPDFIPVAGIIDDAFVLKLVYNAIQDEFEEWKNNNVA